MWKISKLLQKAPGILHVKWKTPKNIPRHSNNHLYLANLLGYTLEGFFNTDNCQNYWQNLHSWSLVRREGITGRESDNKYEDEGWSAAQTLRVILSSSPVLWAIKYIAGAGSDMYVSCAGLNICDGVPGRRNFETRSRKVKTDKFWHRYDVWEVEREAAEGELTEIQTKGEIWAPP